MHDEGNEPIQIAMARFHASRTKQGTTVSETTEHLKSLGFELPNLSTIEKMLSDMSIGYDIGDMSRGIAYTPGQDVALTIATYDLSMETQRASLSAERESKINRKFAVAQIIIGGLTLIATIVAICVSIH